MWILFVFILTTQAGQPVSASQVNYAVVDKYSTYEDCITKKVGLEAEFTKAYPGETDWAFFCVKPNIDKKAA